MADPTALKYGTVTSTFEAKEHILQVEDQMQTINAELTPLVTHAYQMGGTKNVGDTVFHHHEDALLKDTLVLTGAAAVGTDTLTAANDYIYLVNKDVLMNERTKELVIINDTSIASGANTIIRPIGGTTEVAMVVGDVMRKVGTSFPEGGTAPAALLTIPDLKTWYTQFQRFVTELTYHKQAIQNRYGSARAHEVWKKTAEAKRRLEFLLFFSGATSDTTAGGTALDRMSAGLYNTITTNVEGNMGTLTLGELRDLCDAPRRYHPEGRFRMFAGQTVIGIINDLCEDKIRITPSTRSYGMNIKELHLGKCTIILEEEPLWTTTYLSRLAFILPEPISKYMKIATFKGDSFSGEMIWHQNIKTDDGNTTWKDELRFDKGLQVFQEQRFALIDGITG